MKKFFIFCTALLIFLLASTAFADSHAIQTLYADHLILITSQDGAVLYDSIDRETAVPIAWIPHGAVALRIADTDWGYCITFGTYAGYIFDWVGMPVSSNQYSYLPPDGTNYDYADRNTKEYVPEFPYEPIPCTITEAVIATRSGPTTDYTWCDTYPNELNYSVFYKAAGNGIEWGYVEFEYNGLSYRLYTGTWRMQSDLVIPFDSEENVWAYITRPHTAYLGPGYEYAPCEITTPSGMVKAFYQENGWLMYEYTLDSGEIHRAWAPPECWE